MADWKKIRSEYVRSDISYHKLADKYGVPFSTLSHLAKRENWTVLRRKARETQDIKAAEKIGEKKAQNESIFEDIANLILTKIRDGINDGSIEINGRGWRDVTGALKDLRDIKGLKSELDMQEQLARIEKLRKDAKEETPEDKSIKVVISDGADEYSI